MAHNANLSNLSTDDETDHATPRPERGTPGNNLTGEVVGAGIGGTTGGLTGAAIGTALGGPIGAAIGAVAGVVVGALSGKAIADANAADEEHWRTSFSKSPDASEGDFENYADAYRYGHSAADRSAGRQFSEVEQELQSDYERTPSAAKLPYEKARRHIADAYDRRRQFVQENPPVEPAATGISAAVMTGAATAAPAGASDNSATVSPVDIADDRKLRDPLLVNRESTGEAAGSDQLDADDLVDDEADDLGLEDNRSGSAGSSDARSAVANDDVLRGSLAMDEQELAADSSPGVRNDESPRLANRRNNIDDENA